MTTNLSRRIIILTIPFFLAPPWAAAQPPPPIDYPYGNTIGITPAMAVIFASIVSTFLLMGCLSVYARRCADYGGVIHDGAAAINLTPSGRRSVDDGLDPSVIGSFPTFGYSEVKGLKIGKGALECAVCLSEFEDEDTLRLLPKCCHVFHQACVDLWLYSNITCPVCRAVLVPRPGETNNFVLPVREPEATAMADDDIIIEIQSPELDDTSQTPKQSLPPRSKNQLFGKFKRSFTTGHVVVQPGDDYERFTLRLPEEVRSRFVSRSMSRVKSSVIFPRARSMRSGYKSASVGATKGRSLFNYERFEPEGWRDRWRFMRTPSVVSRTGSSHSPHWICGRDCVAEHLVNAQKKMSRSVKSSSFHRTTCETSDRIKEDVDVGELDRLIYEGDQV